MGGGLPFAHPVSVIVLLRRDARVQVIVLTMSTRAKKQCASCGIYLNKVKGTKKTLLTSDDVTCYSTFLSKSLAIGDIICPSCRTKSYRKRNEQNIEQMASTSSDFDVEQLMMSNTSSSDNDDKEDSTYTATLTSASKDDEYVELPIQRTISTHSYCCVCGVKKDIHIIPQRARIQAFIKKNIYIPSGNRCCRLHIIKERFYENDLNALKVHSNMSTLTMNEMTFLFENIRSECNTTIFDRIADQSLSEEQLHIFTGLTWDNINDLREMMTSMHNTTNRTITQALITFLVKLRTGGSNKLICTMLQLKNEQVISDYSSSIINSFEKDILPFQFGLRVDSRQWLIDNHTTAIAKKLYDADDHLILICDGTYARHQKSKNNEYQRKSFSGQKKVSLCKPFTICTTDGYIVDMCGPFYANQNDAEIMRQIIDDPEGLCTLMQTGDIFVLDRGFRDIVPYLQSKGFRVLMPSIKGQRKQLTALEANDSRFVTKVRWAVESVHGMLKEKNKLLKQVFDNKMLHRIRSYYRIASYLLNRYGKRLTSDTDTYDEILERMIKKKNEDNNLAKKVEDEGWLRKKLTFASVTSSDIMDFPEMTDTDLKILFTGTYQFGQAISYLGEILNDNGTLNMYYVKDQSNILKIQVQSRHISKKVYKCFIDYTPNNNGVDGIKQYFCECANGLRTVGCCSHVAAVIYYLSYGRFLSRIPRPSEKLSMLFKTEGISVVINDDSDED